MTQPSPEMLERARDVADSAGWICGDGEGSWAAPCSLSCQCSHEIGKIAAALAEADAAAYARGQADMRAGMLSHLSALQEKAHESVKKSRGSTARGLRAGLSQAAAAIRALDIAPASASETGRDAAP